jgi:hypothetical protein
MLWLVTLINLEIIGSLSGVGRLECFMISLVTVNKCQIEQKGICDYFREEFKFCISCVVDFPNSKIV